MSLADALIPHISENTPVDLKTYFAHDVEQPAPIDQDEDMDDLFDEDAVVDQAERYSIPPSVCYNLFIDCYVGTLSQKRVRIRRWARRHDF
jgi:hypothetical protein